MFNFPLATLIFVRSYRKSVTNPFVWSYESIASTRASKGRFDANGRSRGSSGTEMQREASRLRVLFARYRAQASPVLKPDSPFPRLVSFLRRQISNRTNAALSRAGNDCLRNAPDSWFRAASRLKFIFFDPYLAPDILLLECRFKFESDLYLRSSDTF